MKKTLFFSDDIIDDKTDEEKMAAELVANAISHAQKMLDDHSNIKASFPGNQNDLQHSCETETILNHELDMEGSCIS